MKTQDLFKFNRSSKRLNETISRVFGKKMDFTTFDTVQLEDARNKLRTQIHSARTASGFNETIENETLSQAQWMHDAIVAELVARQEHIVDTTTESDDDIMDNTVDDQLTDPTNEAYINDAKDAINVLADIRAQSKLASRGEAEPVRPNQLVNDLWDVIQWIENNIDEVIETESAPPGAKAERMVKHIKKGYAKDGELTDKERGIAYATSWKQHNKEKNESTESGEYMTKLTEGEVQQASAIVTAKTMVDRVSRWIEELSGMENDTLLQLGDSIRDEMGQEQAKNFISACAPAIQQALENLKTTRETLATGVRQLTGEEQGAEMLGGEPEAMGGEEEIGAAEPDMMNTGDEEGAPADEFAAAEPAAGGLGDAGREQRESINRSNNLLKVLAG
jgi:hypothetical protein